MFYMLDKDNIFSTNVSEAVEKIPTDEKDCHICTFMCFTLCSHSILTKSNFLQSQTDI